MCSTHSKRADWWPYLESHLEGDYPSHIQTPTGREVRWLKVDMDPQEASQELVKLGVPGIRYLDRFSRLDAAKNYGVAQQGATRNFVLTDEDMIKVVRHYNAAGLPALLGQIAAPQTQGQ